MRKNAIALISLFFLVLTIKNVYAIDVDITEFDDRLGEALGVGAFGGGLILSVFFMFLFFALMGLVMRRQPSSLMTIFMGIAVASMCIAFGWFPVWSLIIIILLISFLFGNKIVGGFR